MDGIKRPMPVIQFNAVTLDNNYYRCPSGGAVPVRELVRLAEGLTVFDLDISAVWLGAEVFGSDRLNAYDLAHHCIRVGAVDITKPIIMNLDGWIMDGWHRIVRAVMECRTHIPAVRFETQLLFNKKEWLAP